MTQRAVHALTDNELLQAIIGSGSAGSSVTHIARQVQKLLKRGIPTFQTLLMVKGVGEALAARLVAVFELASRLATLRNEGYPGFGDRAPCIDVMYSDVTGRLLGQRQFSRNEPAATLLQYLCAQAITLSASRISVRFMYESPPKESALEDLVFVRNLHAATALFGITVGAVERRWGSVQRELV